MQSDASSYVIDSHCHLDLEQFDDDRDEVVARAEAEGVRYIIDPGIDVAHSRAAIALAERYPAVYATVGVHPNHAIDYEPAMLDEIRELASHPKVVAIGEIGLDFYWKEVPPEQQKRSLRDHLALAAELGLPVIIHSRESNEDVAAEMRNWVQSESFRTSALAKRPFAGVLHSFSGDAALAEEAYDWGFVLSLGGPVTFKNATDLHTLVPQLRLDRLMIETDAPFLTPHPYRGKRNEPSRVRLVCQGLANLFGVAEEEVAAVTSSVAEKFYALES